MCGVVATVLGGIASALVSQLFSSDKPSTPAPQPVQAPAASQAAQTPDEAARRSSSDAVMGATDSPASTLLTGPGGVSADETKAKLGKNTALGA